MLSKMIVGTSMQICFFRSMIPMGLLCILYSLWLFNIAMEAMAHLQMIFQARNLHENNGFSSSLC